MKQPERKWMAAAVMAGVMLASTPVFASTPVVNIVAGTVTGVNGDQITVDGKIYNVDVQGSALQALGQLHPGDQVQLILSGPPGSAAAKVEGIQVHSGN